VTTYSASPMHRAMELYFFEDQEIRDRPRNWHVLKVLFLATLHPA
jgi:hypothetical protein